MLDLMAQDREVVEGALPSHMMYLLYENMKADGWEIRYDVLKALNVACLLPFQNLDELAISRCAKKTDDLSKSLLHDLSPDDARHGLLDVSAFALILGNEGFIDPTSQPCLVGLALIGEMQADGENWGYSEDRAYQRGGTLLSRARFQNYYAQPRFNKIAVDPAT